MTTTMDPVLPRRHLQKVNQVSETECSLTSSLRTYYDGRETATGIMFTVKAAPTTPLHLLTVEFQVNDNVDDNEFPVQVYGRPDGFSGHIDAKSEWNLLADTKARLAPDARGAIVPAQDFEPVRIEGGETYALYVTLTNAPSVLKLSPTDALIGEVSAGGVIDDATDEGESSSASSSSSPLFSLEIHTGVSLEGTESFPSSFDQAAHFNGVVHYRSNQLCEDARITTDVTLEFAVDDDPSEAVIKTLTDGVRNGISAIMTLTPPLSTYTSTHLLAIDDVKSDFQGRSKEKCPTEFGDCSLLSTMVRFVHLETLDPGSLQVAVLSEQEQLMRTLSLQVNAGIEYIGEPLIAGEFLITLVEVPKGATMTTGQIQYFERITSAFLRDVSGMPIYTASVSDESPSEVDNDGLTEGENPDSRRLLSSSSSTHLRGFAKNRRGRGLQTATDGTIKILTEITGSGSSADLRTQVLEGIGNNEDRYKNELVIQQLRPAEITPTSAGAFFGGISGVFAEVKPNNVVGNNDEMQASGEPNEGSNYWVIVCILGIVFSLFFLLWRVYRDFFSSPNEEIQKLNNRKKPKGILSHLPSLRKSQEGDTGRMNSDETPRFDESSHQASSADHSQTAETIDSPSTINNIPKSRSLHVKRTGSTPDLRGMGSTDHPRMERTSSSKSLDFIPQGAKNQAGERGRGIQHRKSLPPSLQSRKLPFSRSTTKGKGEEVDDESVESEISEGDIEGYDEFAEEDDAFAGAQSVVSEDSEMLSHVSNGKPDIGKPMVKNVGEHRGISSRSLESVESEIDAGEWDSSDEESIYEGGRTNLHKKCRAAAKRIPQSLTSVQSDESEMEEDLEIPLFENTSDESDEENLKNNDGNACKKKSGTNDQNMPIATGKTSVAVTTKRKPRLTRHKSSKSLPELTPNGGPRGSLVDPANDTRTAKTVLTKKTAPRNQSGMNGRGVKKSKSLTEIGRPALQLQYNVEEFDSSSDESEIEEETMDETKKESKGEGVTGVEKKVPSKKKQKKIAAVNKSGKNGQGLDGSKSMSSERAPKASKLAAKRKAAGKMAQKQTQQSVKRDQEELSKASTKSKTSAKSKMSGSLNDGDVLRRGVAATKSMPMTMQGPTIEVVADDSSDVSSLTASLHAHKFKAPPPSRSKIIRNHLRDTSVQPMDLITSVFRPQHMRETSPESPAGKRASSADCLPGKSRKIKYEPKKAYSSHGTTVKSSNSVPDLSLRLIAHKAKLQEQEKLAQRSAIIDRQYVSKPMEVKAVARRDLDRQSQHRSKSQERRNFIKGHLETFEADLIK